MRLRVSVESWAAGLFLALAVSPAPGCSQVVISPSGGSGSGGGTSSGSSGSTGSGSTGSGSSGSGSPLSALCKGSMPLVVQGKDTGYETCMDGAVHRREALDCPSEVPRPAPQCMPSPGSGCTQDTDCVDHPNGFCSAEPAQAVCFCNYGCTKDTECSPGEICLCGDPVGQCVQASCAGDTSCPSGALCADYVIAPGCDMLAFACQTAADECLSSKDCSAGAECTLTNGHRVCHGMTCSPGRPFLIGGTPRLAEPAPRGDWLAATPEPRLDGLDRAQREALAAHWTRAGQMEHASIAAFARFALQLLSVGAPADLVEAAQAAMADETLHARLCFALASAYAGRAIGPGRLALRGALDGLDAEDERAILVSVIREGCIGETVAALEAAEALEHAQDPAVRAVLARIAEDERRHALLAWRYVAWAIERGGEKEEELRATLREEIDAAGRQEGAGGAEDAALLAMGLLGGRRCAEIRRVAMAQAIRPCALAL
jgi:hypothetical protein